MRRPRVIEPGFVTGIAASLVLAGWLIGTRAAYPSTTFQTGCGSASGPWLSAHDATDQLPAYFANGSVPAFGSNATSVIFGGIAYYERNHVPYDSQPALGSFSPASSTGQDLTQRAGPFFERGGVFPVGWNGSGWLIAGRATYGANTEGSAIFLHGGQITN
ncbi:MAG: hypothetical protein ACREEC_09055, partial [Thermoplasmata archaeon]